KSSAVAGAAGAGGGTLVALFAATLPAEYAALKGPITLVAPSLSFAIRAFWLWLDGFVKQREYHANLEKAKETLRRNLGDPNISDAHRQQVKRDMEKLQIIEQNFYLRRIIE